MVVTADVPANGIKENMLCTTCFMWAQDKEDV